MSCPDCGAMVVDQNVHAQWHAAIADIWDWIDRVAGASCETARQLFEEGSP